MGSATEMNTYTVAYDTTSHWKVLTQRAGSIWPKVLPYCVFNVFLMIALIYIDDHYGTRIKIESTPLGHTFISMVVAFLLVTRVSIAQNRYNQARDCLGVMYREARSLVQNACLFSLHNKSTEAREWRYELSYRMLLLLRTSMAVIDYPSTGVAAWDLPELSGNELVVVKNSVFSTPELRRYAHCPRSEMEECMRVPIRLAFLLRKTIQAQVHRMKKNGAMTGGQESNLYGIVDSFLGGYYGIRKFLSTPLPFPMIQMARTFLFLFIISFPFVLLPDKSSNVAHCVAVFLVTYAFMGLEIVAIELDNPFGEDPNDFDNDGMACVAYEDMYLTILDIDGQEWADKLREAMHDDRDTEYDPRSMTELSWEGLDNPNKIV